MLNTLELREFYMILSINGESIFTETSYGYNAAIDMACSLDAVLSALGKSDTPTVVVINDKHVYKTTISNAKDVTTKWIKEQI